MVVPALEGDLPLTANPPTFPFAPVSSKVTLVLSGVTRKYSASNPAFEGLLPLTAKPPTLPFAPIGTITLAPSS